MSPFRGGRPCSHPGCTVIVHRGSRCAAHAEAFHDQAYRAWYQTPRWRAVRAAQLQRAPWCADCKDRGELVAAVDVDHVEPHRGDETKFYTGPFQSLCKACHSKKTRAEVGGV